MLGGPIHCYSPHGTLRVLPPFLNVGIKTVPHFVMRTLFYTRKVPGPGTKPWDQQAQGWDILPTLFDLIKFFCLCGDGQDDRDKYSSA